MDFEIEQQLRNELADAQRPVDRYKHAAKVYAAERDHARANFDRIFKILMGIHALLSPPIFTDDKGQAWAFHSPIIHEQVQMLSDRIRAIPDEIAAIEKLQKLGAADDTAPA